MSVKKPLKFMDSQRIWQNHFSCDTVPLFALKSLILQRFKQIPTRQALIFDMVSRLFLLTHSVQILKEQFPNDYKLFTYYYLLFSKML